MKSNEEVLMRTPCKRIKNLVLAVAVFLPLILGGCKSVKYSYDTGTGLSGLKTYAWALSSVGYGDRDSLLETNVRVLADQLLAQKGFTKVREKLDLFISTYYESEIGYYSRYDYKVRSLALNMYNPETNELIWQGSLHLRGSEVSTPMLALAT
jgi:hypothetical protein